LCQKLLVARGADINATDIQGVTPLGAASSASHDVVVSYLLSIGASLDARRLATSPEVGANVFM
jgi:ankyrin repeat protein